MIVYLRTGMALLATVFWCSLGLILYPFWRRACVVMQHLWARNLLWWTRIKVSSRGNDEIKGPVIFASNHQSSLDIISLAALFEDLRFVSKAELRRAPFVGLCMHLSGHVFLDRDRKKQTIEALRDAAVDVRKVGRSVVIFPEGTRFVKGKLGPFKRGIILFARACELPIVPVGIRNSLQLMPPTGIKATPGVVEIHIGEPINVSDYDGRDRELLSVLRQEILELSNYDKALEAEGVSAR